MSTTFKHFKQLAEYALVLRLKNGGKHWHRFTDCFNLTKKVSVPLPCTHAAGAAPCALTLPLSSSSWHLLRQSGLLVNSTRAFSAWCRTAVSVVSYSCLHRISSWARPWMRHRGRRLSATDRHMCHQSVEQRITPCCWRDFGVRQCSKLDHTHGMRS